MLDAMIAATPPGSARPWRTSRSISTIGDLLDDGIGERDLLELVEGAAELIRRGLERPHWWTVGNLFGPKTLERWRNEIVAMQERDAKRAAEDAAERARAEAHAAALREPNPLAIMSLARVAGRAHEALLAQWSREREDDDAAKSG